MFYHGHISQRGVYKASACIRYSPSIAVDKMDRATYLRQHLFQTTQRNQRRLSRTSAPSPPVPCHPLPPLSPHLPLYRIAYSDLVDPLASFLPVSFFSLLTSSVGRRWRVAVDSRFKWAWAYRDRADHPLFPRRTTPFPMNNAFSRGNRYADCRSVPAYTRPGLFPRLSHAAATRRCADLGQWKTSRHLRFSIFFPPIFFSLFFFFHRSLISSILRLKRRKRE